MDQKPQCTSIGCNRPRALLKAGMVALILAMVLTGLVFLVSDQRLEDLKHTLSLPGIILLVVIINLASFLFFITLYAAYHWIRRDLKPGPAADSWTEEI